MTFTVSRDQILGAFNGKRYVFVPHGLCTRCVFDTETAECELMRHDCKRYCDGTDRLDLRLGYWKEAP